MSLLFTFLNLVARLFCFLVLVLQTPVAIIGDNHYFPHNNYCLGSAFICFACVLSVFLRWAIDWGDVGEDSLYIFCNFIFKHLYLDCINIRLLFPIFQSLHLCNDSAFPSPPPPPPKKKKSFSRTHTLSLPGKSLVFLRPLSNFMIFSRSLCFGLFLSVSQPLYLFLSLSLSPLSLLLLLLLFLPPISSPCSLLQ